MAINVSVQYNGESPDILLLLTQDIFSAACCCGNVHQQSVKVYLHTSTTGIFSRTLYAQHTVSQTTVPSLPGSRLRFFIAMQIQSS